MSTAYRGAHRADLDDMSEIEALERAKRGEPDPTTQDPPEEGTVENEPPKPPAPPQGAEEATYAKRYADLRRHAQATEARLKAEVARLAELADKAAKGAMRLPSTEEEVAAWAKEFPDVARIVETIAGRKADERVVDTEKRIQAAEAREREAAKRAANAELMRLHPDFGALRQDPAFHAWAGEQPRWVQMALYEDLDPKAAARAIDLYKLDTAPKRGRPPKQPDTAAAAPPVSERREAPDAQAGKGKVFRESEIAKMRPEQFEKLEDEIYQARREGRFVYDISAAG